MNHPCGDPMSVSSGYYTYPATLIAIVDCTHLEVEVHDLYRYHGSSSDSLSLRVILAGIVPFKEKDPDGTRCMAELRKIPTGAPVEIASLADIDASGIDYACSNLSVRISLKTKTEVNLVLVKKRNCHRC